jgi:hypothetical protein
MSKSKPTQPVPPFALPSEGRLLAHRRLLAEILRNLPDECRSATMDWLDEHALFHCKWDEPGADPNDRIAVELARADELQILKRLVNRKT